MNSRDAIHAIVPTFNAEQHIARCLESIRDHCASITVIDTHSTDRTVEIARGLGADVLTTDWINYATQMNFGIDALAGRGGWLLRIDADEIFDRDSTIGLRDAAATMAPDVDGILILRRMYFLGRRMRYGGIEPSYQLRLWRNGRGRCEQRWADEHIKVPGRVVKSGVVLSDINLNSLAWWTEKHNNYSSREAIDVLNRTHGFLPRPDADVSGMNTQARLRRILKEKVYMKVPGGARAMAYFLYRYLFRLGFLDGRAGLYFHLLQGLWYRSLVDAKLHEIREFAATHGVPITEAIRDRTGVNLAPAQEARAVTKSGEDPVPGRGVAQPSPVGS